MVKSRLSGSIMMVMDGWYCPCDANTYEGGMHKKPHLKRSFKPTLFFRLPGHQQPFHNEPPLHLRSFSSFLSVQLRSGTRFHEVNKKLLYFQSSHKTPLGTFDVSRARIPIACSSRSGGPPPDPPQYQRAKSCSGYNFPCW